MELFPNRSGVPARFTLPFGRAGFQPMENGHAGGDAVFKLVADERAFVVHDGITEFDAAVTGPVCMRWRPWSRMPRGGRR